MNGLENLVIGKEYKYKELCALFGEKVKTSNSKKAQLKEWERFIRWTNPIPTKYRIEEIYEIPKEKIDGRKSNGGNSTTKFPLLEDILMDYFIDKKEIKSTLPTLATEIGILTEEYTECRNNISEFSKNHNIHEDIIYAYLNNIRSCVISSIESSIERLSNKGFLESQSYYVLAFENGGRKICSGEEAVEIVSIENTVLNEMGIKRNQLFQPKYFHSFSQNVHELLSNSIGNDVKYHYKEYHIKLKNDNYQNKSVDDIYRTTRKFIITIGISMLRYICKKHKILEKEGITQTELVENIIYLSNCFFVHMDSDSWDKFINENEFNNENYATLFLTQYCLIKTQNELENKKSKDRAIFSEF